MATRISITIEAPEKHPDILDVRDAMQQVLDFFDLLTDETEANVVWNLAAASTNSPLTIEGEPVDIRTNAAATSAVAPLVAAVETGWQRVAAGDDWGDAFPAEKRLIADRILKRSADGVGATKVAFRSGGNVIQISQETAKYYFRRTEERSETLYNYLFSRKPRREYGAVEGRIASLGTDYDHPSILLCEANTGKEFQCRVDEHVLDEVRETMKAGDVWGHRRVRIRGLINFDKDGNIIRIYEGSLAFIDPPHVELSDLHDPDFTGGYTVAEYIDRLREGDLD